MRYVSTRGNAPVENFEGVVLQGLAPDGGLYLPASWPQFSHEDLLALRGKSYIDVAVAVMAPFTEGVISAGELRGLCEQAYASFRDDTVVPVVPLDAEADLHIVELFHGPTLAFKDVALQLLGRIFDHLLARKGERVTVLGATSGDTGSAAIEGCRGRDALDIFILHPQGRPSEVQRRQMTTVLDDNVYNIAVQGTFDDCQDMVKAMFRDPTARKELRLTAVNSINWARVLAQIVYYFTTALALGAPGKRVSFCVPTGNFGDIFAGWCAAKMGLPIERLIIATNANDILARTLSTGRYGTHGVSPTLSPSMDIQLSSNFERLLFTETDGNAEQVRTWMEALRTEGGFTLDETTLNRLRARFDAGTVNDEATLQVIANTWKEHGMLVDPHTAVGVGVAQALTRQPNVALAVLATAHPAKFPDAVEQATGQRPPLPEALADLYERPERATTLPNEADAVEAWIRERARALT